MGDYNRLMLSYYNALMFYEAALDFIGKWIFFLELLKMCVLVYLVVRLKMSNCSESAAKKLVSKGFSDRNWFVCLALWCFLGFFGGHRFYCGKVKTGILYMLTGGLFFIGVIIDACMIFTGNFKDCNGKAVKMG